MKVETPQILWNSEGDKGINAALNSISMLQSGLSEHDDDETTNNNINSSSVAAARRYGNVLVTAGNTHVINLWKLSFASSNKTSSQKRPQQQQQSSSTAAASNTASSSSNTKIDYLCSLTRQEQAVNTVAFSPDGLHLATGGETGAIVVWSVPPSKRGGGNGRHYWSTVEREQDLNVRIVSRSGEGVCDISWSADSKRFMAGTIDHTVLICEDKNYHSTTATDCDWQIVHRNSMDHTHYVQGVAYDPLGVYLASMGSDRTVRVFPRKTPSKYKKKVLRPANSSMKDSCPPPEHQLLVHQLLAESKLEVGKSKLIKYVRRSNNSSRNAVSEDNVATTKDNKPQRSHMYADESTLESFFRRLSWTTDGAYLVTPAALHHKNSATANNYDTNESPSFATYLFARHKFDEPCKVLSGLEKPSVVVRANPVLFKLPGTDGVSVPAVSTNEEDESKENQKPSSASDGSRRLPYRSVFAVLTTDSILVYDTHHTRPLSVVRGLHYAGLSDCQWSADGMKLVVSSIDGYVSILSFQNGELGEVYHRPALPVISLTTSMQSSLKQSCHNSLVEEDDSKPNASSFLKPQIAAIPPCEPGQSATLEAPPSKKAKTRITPTLISAPANGSSPVIAPTKKNSSMATTTNVTKRPANDLLEQETHTVGEAVTKLTLSNTEQPKKKKRIQPMLISAGN